MSTCPKCKSDIAPDARYCTGCGTSAAPLAELLPDAVEACSDETHAALAAANLYKLRGDWQSAVDKCMEVLAADQDNATAHSILGDIYRDQGKITDAMHWYKLALDLNPDSAADRVKLEQLIAHSRNDRLVRRRRLDDAMTTARRVVLEAALAIGLLALLTTVWPIIWGPRTSPENTRSELRSPSSSPRVHLPADVPAPAEPVRKPVQHSVGASMSEHEDAVLQAVNASPALVQRGLHATSILIDPRSRSAVVCMFSPPPKNEPAAQWLARSALIVLREACFKDGSLERFTIRVVSGVVHGETATTKITFVADAERNSVLSIVPETADYAQLAGVLRNPWWAEGIRP